MEGSSSSSSRRWYFNKKELRNSPSVVQGLSSKTEARYLQEGVQFIIDLGRSMNLLMTTTISTGIVYFHRFYTCQTFSDFPRYPTATACLFLAGKVEETPKKCKDMLKNSQELLKGLDSDNDIYAEQFGEDLYLQMEKVMTLEKILLRTIKFDLQVEHPYRFLLRYTTCLKGHPSRRERMLQMACNFVNDCWGTRLCLQWEPEIIAIGFMHLASKLKKFKIVDWEGRTSAHSAWWDLFVKELPKELVEDIGHQILDKYFESDSGQANEKKQSSPPLSSRSNSSSAPSGSRKQVSPKVKASISTSAAQLKVPSPISSVSSTGSTPTLSSESVLVLRMPPILKEQTTPKGISPSPSPRMANLSPVIISDKMKPPLLLSSDAAVTMPPPQKRHCPYDTPPLAKIPKHLYPRLRRAIGHQPESASP